MFNMNEKYLDKQLKYNKHRVKQLDYVKSKTVETYQLQEWDKFVEWFNYYQSENINTNLPKQKMRYNDWSKNL